MCVPRSNAPAVLPVGAMTTDRGSIVTRGGRVKRESGFPEIFLRFGPGSRVPWQIRRVNPLGVALSGLLAQDGGTLLLGEDFFPWIVLALGAAMVVGNLLAVVRSTRDGAPVPMGRALAFVALGGVAAVWGLASLLR